MYVLYYIKKESKENKNGKRTRTALLKAAGEIFAKKGYEATSVRDIAMLANTPFGAITYHFKTKKDLFKRTLEYFILDNPKFNSIFKAFDSADSSRPETLSEAMYESIKNIVYDCHKPKFRIKYINGLIMSLFKDDGKDANKMIQILREETMDGIYRLLCESNPRLTRTDIYWWSHIFWALSFYPVYGKMLLLSESGEKNYSPEFLDSRIFRIANTCFIMLGLPPPKHSDPWELHENPINSKAN